MVIKWHTMSKMGYMIANNAAQSDINDWLAGPCESLWRNQIFPQLIVASEEVLASIGAPRTALTSCTAARAFIKMRVLGAAINRVLNQDIQHSRTSIAWILR